MLLSHKVHSHVTPVFAVFLILVVPFMKMQMLTVLFTKPLAEPFQALTGIVHVEWKNKTLRREGLDLHRLLARKNNIA